MPLSNLESSAIEHPTLQRYNSSVVGVPGFWLVIGKKYEAPAFQAQNDAPKDHLVIKILVKAAS